MFLLKTAFWVAAVVVLMPREPDLGLPRTFDAGACEARCVDAPAWLSEFRAVALSSLARVKADLEAAPRG